jgi:hypothetical protein
METLGLLITLNLDDIDLDVDAFFIQDLPQTGQRLLV